MKGGIKYRKDRIFEMNTQISENSLTDRLLKVKNSQMVGFSGRDGQILLRNENVQRRGERSLLFLTTYPSSTAFSA